jgi:hypothetical protein
MRFLFNVKSSEPLIYEYENPNSQLPIAFEETINGKIVLIGKIYEPSTTLSEVVKNLSFNDNYYSGRFILVSFCKDGHLAKIWTDKYHTLGAFFGFDGGSFFIGNCPLLARHLLVNQTPDLQGIVDLIYFGFIQPPFTLYSDILMISGHGTVNFLERKTSQTDTRSTWPTQNSTLNSETSSEKFYSNFKVGLNSLLKNWGPQTFRLSGGADSRLIASALNPGDAKNMNLEVVCAPHLSELEDRDVLGAQAICKLMNANLNIRHFSKETSGFFSGLPKNRAALSGLYGGEFLGNVAFSMVPKIDWNFSSSLREPEINLFNSELLANSSSRARTTLDSFGTRAFLTSVYLGAYRSNIYASTRYSWASPHFQNLCGLSPFVESNILDSILEIPSIQLDNYSFYRKLFTEQVDKRWIEIPFCSPILNSSSDRFSSFSTGLDPKDTPFHTESQIREPSEFILEHLFRLGVLAGPLKRSVPMSNVLKSRLINLQIALDSKNWTALPAQ